MNRSRALLLTSSLFCLFLYNSANLAATPLVSAEKTIAGGKTKIKSNGSGDVRWILPGKRRLDPAVFGTPATPLGFEPDVGLPVAMRLTTSDGSAWTTTKWHDTFFR